MKVDVYQLVTDQIIKALEQGGLIWRKPWETKYGESPYRSHTNGKTYSFLNCFLLMSQGGAEGEYLTAAQAHAEGGHIKKGAKAKFVVFSKRYDKEVKRVTCSRTWKRNDTASHRA